MANENPPPPELYGIHDEARSAKDDLVVILDKHYMGYIRTSLGGIVRYRFIVDRRCRIDEALARISTKYPAIRAVRTAFNEFEITRLGLDLLRVKGRIAGKDPR